MSAIVTIPMIVLFLLFTAGSVIADGPATDLGVRIVSITVSDERAASVVLHADDWHDKYYTDHFHPSGVWKIVSKIFSER